MSYNIANQNEFDLSYIQGNLIPAQSNYYTIGTQQLRWKDIFLGPGTINITDSVTGNNAAISVANGVFFINGVTQAQLPNVTVTNLTFSSDNTVQTTAFAPNPTSYNPLFTDATGTLAGITATASYTLVGKLCYVRVYVSFTDYTDLGTGEYQTTLPFPSIATMTLRGGTLHNVSGGSLYHIAGIVDIVDSTTVMKLYYSSSTEDLSFKYNRPNNAINNTTHFDISGVYQIV